METQKGRMIDGAEKGGDADVGVTRLVESITQRTQIQLATERSEIARLVHMPLKAQSGLDAAGRDLDGSKPRLVGTPVASS